MRKRSTAVPLIYIQTPFYQFAAMLPTLRELQTHLARSRKHLAGSMSWSTMRASRSSNRYGICRADVVTRPQLMRRRVHRQPIESHEFGPGRLHRETSAHPQFACRLAIATPSWRSARCSGQRLWLIVVCRAKIYIRQLRNQTHTARTLAYALPLPNRLRHLYAFAEHVALSERGHGVVVTRSKSLFPE